MVFTIWDLEKRGSSTICITGSSILAKVSWQKANQSPVKSASPKRVRLRKGEKSVEQTLAS